MESTQKKIKKTENMTEYMRNYMKKRYQAERELGINSNAKYYYVQKNKASHEDKEKYGNYLPYIVKARDAIKQIKENPSILADFLKELEELKSQQNI